MKIKIQIKVVYEGYVHDNDYLESPNEHPSSEEIDSRLLADVMHIPKYYTDRFQTKAFEITRIK
jgi:hypothetical protein